MSSNAFNPTPRTLLGPGPSNVHPRVLEALSRPTVGHLDPQFIGFMESLKDLLRYAFQTENELTLPVSGPGSVGMETCFVNLVEPGDEVVVCVNGVFGGRMKENVERVGGIAVLVEDPWGEAVDPEKLEKTLKDHPRANLVAFVHAETSTGALSDAKALVEIAHRHDCLTIVDAVTSLGGVPVSVDAWGIDAVYSGSQKCLSAPPGLSPVSFNARARERIKKRRHPVQSWFMDLNLLTGYWEGSQGKGRSYHHTAPINALYGLHEALLLLREEGLEKAWSRHRENHDLLRRGLEDQGLSLAVEEPIRLPQLNAVRIPDGVNDAQVRSRLLEEHNLEIGGGLGAFAGKIWRVGLMGYSSRPESVRICLDALESVLGSRKAAK